MTIRDLLELNDVNEFSLDTEIKILGADVNYYKFTKQNGKEIVILDECPIDEEE